MKRLPGAYRWITALVLCSLLLQPSMGVTAPGAPPAVATASPPPQSLPPSDRFAQPLTASGVMTLMDTTRADFEAGTRTNLDTTAISGTVQLAWRPLPVANAGTDQTAAENSSVTLNGSASFSALGEPLSYTWTQLQGTPVTLFRTGTASPTFVAPNLTRNETLVFQLVVHDQAARSAPDTVAVTVTVAGQNDPPTAEAGADQTVREGDLVTLDCTGSYDPNGDT